MTQATPAAWKCQPRPRLRFIAIWVIIPFAFRSWILFTMLSGSATVVDIARGIAYVTATCLPQDILVALEALLVLVATRALVGRVAPRHSNSATTFVATALFFLAHIYLLCDFLLHTKIGIRMDPVFFDFLATASTFMSSAVEIGLFGIVAGIMATLVVTVLAALALRSLVGDLSVSRRSLLAIPAVLLLAVAGHWLLPSQVRYAASNAIYYQQSRWLAGLAGFGELARPIDRDKAARWLTPECEQFDRPDPRYPLLKHTNGFFGARQFDIRIREDERPHVVLLFMESFRAADIGVLGGKYPVSPNFDRASQDGVLFRNFYGNGVQTTRGVIASLFGLPPSFSAKSVQGSMPDLPLIGIADLFNRRGYTSGYLTGCPLAFERQAEFFAAHGYQEVLGADAMSQRFPKASRTSWGYHDEHLMNFAVDWIKQHDKNSQPSFSTVFTISHHHPWKVPADYAAPEFDTGLNSEYANFLQTFHYSDHCLGQFLDMLRAAGLDQKTVVFVLADTGTPQGEHHDNFMLINYLYEENHRIPLLILAPGRLQAAAVVDSLGSQVDLLPTVMDIFGMTGKNHAVGTSLVREAERRVVLLNNPFAQQYHGMRLGRHKYIFNVQGGESHLYDLAQDEGEHDDLSAAAPADVSHYREISRNIHQYLLSLYLQRRLAPPVKSAPDDPAR